MSGKPAVREFSVRSAIYNDAYHVAEVGAIKMSH